MRWIHTLFCALPFGKQPISDSDFKLELQVFLNLLRPARQIEGISELTGPQHVNAEGFFEEATLYHMHSVTVRYGLQYVAPIRPSPQHRSLQISAIHMADTYTRTLELYSKHIGSTFTWETKKQMKQHFAWYHEACYWDRRAHQAAVRLVNDIEGSPLDLTIPDGLQSIADEPIFIPTSIIPSLPGDLVE